MLKILIVEDDPKLSQLYDIVLKKAGYETSLAPDGMKGWDILEEEHIDLIITDIMMPEVDGYEFVKGVRQINKTIPILMITAKDDFDSKHQGFRLGTDDYMTKPIDVNEMVLRVQALLRRAHIMHDKKQVVGSTSLDYDSLTVTYNGEEQMLPQKEFFLLYKLISYPNKIFTRMQLMDEIWGPGSNSDVQTIDVHINRLRRHFQDNPDFEIVTIRGLGYKAMVCS
ncbi:MAG: response regulator transcription factor [Lachnospiraceae bacterium]